MFFLEVNLRLFECYNNVMKTRAFDESININSILKQF